MKIFNPPIGRLRYVFLLICLIYGLIISSISAGDKQTTSWERIKGRLVTLNDTVLLDNVIGSLDLTPNNNVFLFETGDSYSYNYKKNSLQLTLGKKEINIDKDTTLNIPCLYPESKNTIELPFRFFPVSQAGTSEIVYSYQSKNVAIFPLGKYDLIFFDWNHNGYFDDFNNDRYIILPANSFPKTQKTAEEWQKALAPFRGSITIEKQGTYLAAIKPSWELYLWKVSNTLTPDYLAHMGYLNHLRKLQGAEFIGIDETMIPACEKHCHYCAAHGICHDENPSFPEYTTEGNQAGIKSVVGTHGNSVDGLKGMFTTLYHRTPFLLPHLRKISLGCKEGIYVCDVQSFSGGGTNKLICYPFPRQTDVATHANGETPNQIPEDMTGDIGTLIAIRFPNGWTPKFHSATLVNTKTNEQVPCRFTDPHSTPTEARKMFPTNDSCIALFPTKILEQGVIYQITINYFYSLIEASKKDKKPLSVKWLFKTE